MFVFTDGKLQALDCRTGQTIREYPEIGAPEHALYDQGLLITVGANAVHGVDAESGRVLWTHTASEPREVVAGDGIVGLLQGSPRRGETCEVVVLDQRSGRVKWSRSDLPWAARASRSVYHQGMLTFEVSTLSDDGPDNAIHILATKDGQVIRDISFLPGMNHMRQARAMYVGDRLWLLQGGRDADKKGLPVEAAAIDVLTGNELARFPAGLTALFPTGGHAAFSALGRNELHGLADRPSGCQSHHQGRLRARRRLVSRARPGVCHAEALRVLAHAARLRGAGTRAPRREPGSARSEHDPVRTGNGSQSARTG